jgi:Flp pilus assembly protein TadG
MTYDKSTRPPDIRAGRENGSSVVEFVLIIPVMVACLLIALQVTLVWHARHVAQAAARQGLQEARDYRGTDQAGARQAAWHLRTVAPVLLSQPRVRVTRTPATVSVVVHARVQSVIPGARWDVEAHSSGPVERFVTAVAPT